MGRRQAHQHGLGTPLQLRPLSGRRGLGHQSLDRVHLVRVNVRARARARASVRVRVKARARVRASASVRVRVRARVRVQGEVRTALARCAPVCSQSSLAIAVCPRNTASCSAVSSHPATSSASAPACSRQRTCPG